MYLKKSNSYDFSLYAFSWLFSREREKKTWSWAGRDMRVSGGKP